MNHAKTSFSTEIFAGAIISMVEYLEPLLYVLRREENQQDLQHPTVVIDYLMSHLIGVARYHTAT
jgi:hypothetical protein